MTPAWLRVWAARLARATWIAAGVLSRTDTGRADR